MQLPKLCGRQDRRHAYRSGSVPAYHLLDARTRSQRFLLAVAGRGRAGDLATLAFHSARLAFLRGARRGWRGGDRRRVRWWRGWRGSPGGDTPQSRNEFHIQAQHFRQLVFYTPGDVSTYYVQFNSMTMHNYAVLLSHTACATRRPAWYVPLLVASSSS